MSENQSPEGDHSQEELLGYLLGALDAAEEAAIAERLAHDAKLAEQCARLDQQLNALGPDDEPYDPPLGLAARTMANIPFGKAAPTNRVTNNRITEGPLADEIFLGELVETETSATGTSPSSTNQPTTHAELTPRPEPLGAGRRGLRWADVIVAAGVCAAAAVLFFPAIAASRHRASLAACQNNLMNIGFALTGFSDRNDGVYPAIPVSGNASIAGVHAPLLRQAGYLEEDQTLLCPSSELAKQRNNFHVVSVADLEAAQGRELTQLQRRVGGSYGYTLGHVDDEGQYQANINRRRANFAVAADAPSPYLKERQSDNHGGCGQNVLYEDGHVAYLTRCRSENSGDDVFTSDRGYVEAGRHWNDAVVAESAASPILRTVAHQR